MPEISVIVPVYKVEPYLRRCVDSILGQTFTDFEVILVDDGSPDACPAICDEYAGKDERVRVIHQENGGLSAARNAGLDWVFANSDSRWISFVDSDDWVHPRFLEYLHRAVIENNTPISVCNFEKVEISTNICDNISQFNCFTDNALDFYANHYLLGTVSWNKLYDRLLFAQQRYPVGKLHEDAFLTYKLLYDAGSISYINECLYYYYQNNTGIMLSPYSVKRLHEIEAFEEQLSFFKEKGLVSNYNICEKKLLWLYAMHSKSLFAIDNPKYKELQKKLKHLLPKYRNSMSLKKDPYIYEAAYPKLIAWYWRIQAVKNLVHKYGVFAVIGRIFQKIGAKLTNDT